MRSMFGFITFVLLLFFSVNASADDVWKSMNIAGVQSLPDGGFIIYGPYGADTLCAEGRLFYVRANQNGQSPDGVKATFAAVLTAFTAGKTINFYYNNMNSNCYVNTVFVAP